MSYFNFLKNGIFSLLAFVTSVLLIIRVKTRKAVSLENIKPLDSHLFLYIDPKKNTLHVSNALKTLLSLKSSTIAPTDFISYFDKSCRDTVAQLCYYDGLYIDTPIRVKANKDITQKTIFLTCSRLFLNYNSPNTPQPFFLLFSDVTKQTLLENNLKYENEILKKNLAHKNNILNTLPIPIWSRNQDLDIDYFNNAYNQIISDINIDTSSQIIQEISKKEKNLASKAKKTKLLQKEEKHIVIQGTRYLYELQETPMQGSESTVGMGYDITIQDSLRSALQMHISAQSDLLESTANASAIYDSRTRLMFFNQTFVKLWNLDEKWLVSQPTYGEILEALREKRQLPEQIDFQLFKRENIQLFNNLMSPHNDFFYLPDGRYLRVIVIPHALGGLLFSYEDITDKLTLEKEYKTLSAVQKETIDHLNEGISVFSENGKLQISNEQFSKLWNFDKTYLRSKPHITDIITKISTNTKNSNINEEFINNINSRTTNNLELQTNNNATIDVLFVPLPDGATLISYRDITDSILVEKTLIERNEALQDADKLKTEFLANVSYELRSPLTSIIGFSQALNKQYFGKLNDIQTEYITGISDSSQYLLTLINDILDLASIDAGYMQLEISRFNIYTSIMSLVELVQERVKERKLKFTLLCSNDIGDMSGDIRRIKQVLFKLISNAIDNSQAGQSIKLTIKKEHNNYVIFSVEDNCTIINDEEQKYIFDTFHKIDTKRMKSKSASLGLALVKNFIELHGGVVKFTSKKPKGAIFECIVPCITADYSNIAIETQLAEN